MDAGLRVFRIGGKKDLSNWEWLLRLVRHWDAMEEIVRTRRAGPWFYSINEARITEVKLD